jgi:hypothetical protein
MIIVYRYIKIPCHPNHYKSETKCSIFLVVKCCNAVVVDPGMISNETYTHTLKVEVIKK